MGGSRDPKLEILAEIFCTCKVELSSNGSTLPDAGSLHVDTAISAIFATQPNELGPRPLGAGYSYSLPLPELEVFFENPDFSKPERFVLTNNVSLAKVFTLCGGSDSHS